MSTSDISAAVNECVAEATRREYLFLAIADYMRELELVHGWQWADICDVAERAAEEVMARVGADA